jgi:hypothetical protein
MKNLLLTFMVIAVYLVHQDFWNWRNAEPLVLGVLPIGLAYHAAYSVLASIMMAVLVKYAWPGHLGNTGALPTKQSASPKLEGAPR